MSNDTFTEVTSQSWFSRIGNSLKGIIFGLVLVVISFPLLFWNEGRAVKRYKTLNEGSGAVISITADTVDSSNQGKLVHLSGRARTDETLSDQIFGINREVIKLKRIVEMYQWQEESQSQEKKKLGGGTETTTTYTYTKTWADRLIRSDNFKKPEGHINPASMPYPQEEKQATEVSLGAFTLSPSLIGKMRDYSTVALGEDYNLPETLAGKATVTSDTVYIGQDISSPMVGDTRVSFMVVRPMDISLVANQVNNTFEPYRAKSGGTVELLVSGIHSAEAMFEQAQKSNTVLTWVLRGVGFILMLIGFKLILGPLSVLADVVPIIGSIVGVGTGFVAWLISGFLSVITIAIAWLFYRPVLAVTLLALAGGIGFYLVKKLRKTPPGPTASADAAP